MMEAAGSGADPVIAGVPLGQFAAVMAALGEAFPLRAVLAVEEIDAARWAEAERGWTARLDDDPVLLVRYETELAVAQARLLTPEEPGRQDKGAGKAKAARGGKPKLVRSGTGLAPAPAATSAIAPAAPEPLFPPPAPAPPPRFPDLIEPGPALGRSKRQQTLVASAMPSADLPFRKIPSREGAAPEKHAVGDSRPPPRRSEDQGTLVGFEVPSPALPFRAVPPATREPPRPANSEDLGTLAAFELPSASLPFRPAPVSVEEIPAPPAPPTAASPAAAPRSLLPLGFGLALAQAPPAVAARESQPPPSRPLTPRLSAPPEPTTGSGVGSFPSGGWGTGVPSPATPHVTSPRMPLEQHASLCLEIAVDPTRVSEALARYQVSAADKECADEFYRVRLAADPELRTQWNRAYELYHAWYTSRPQR